MKKGWTYKKLGEILRFDKRFKGIDKSLQQQIVSFNHVSAEKLREMSVNNGSVKLLATGLFSGYTTEKIAGDFLNQGEVITIPSGGNANIKYYNGKFVDSGNILAVAAHNEITLKYIWYYLLSQNSYLESCYKGTSIKHPFMPDIWNLQVPLTNTKEQQRIVSRLDTVFAQIDVLKANTEKQLSEAKALFQNALKKAVEPKDGWEEKMLSDITEVKDGTHDSPKYVPEGIPFVTQKNITNNGFDLQNTKKISIEDHNKFYIRSNVEFGDIIISMIGANRGMSCVVDTRETFSIKNVGLIKRNDNINTMYLLFYLHSPAANAYILENSNGGAQEFIGLKGLRNFPIPYPPLSEQQKIVSRLDALSENVKELEKILEKTIKECDALKQAILREVFE